MTPRLAIEKFLHSAERQAVLRSELRACAITFRVFTPCGDDDLFGNYDLVISLTAQRPTFGDHVGKVINVGSIKHMTRIVASAIVASVTPIVDGIVAMSELVRNAMNPFSAFTLSRNMDMAISPSLANVERPNQTLVGVVGVCRADQILITGFGGRLSRHRCSPITAVFGALVV